MASMGMMWPDTGVLHISTMGFSVAGVAVMVVGGWNLVVAAAGEKEHVASEVRSDEKRPPAAQKRS